MKRIVYVPLEGYEERYTRQWSAPKTGWLERHWIRCKVPYIRIDGDGQPTQRIIKTGSVVDAVGRAVFSFRQINQLLLMAEQGELTNDDVILFDDFWTPGFEALPYAFHLLGIKPKMYAFWHAQSVDEFDFTYPMKDWIRSIESGMLRAMDGIFVCCPMLKDMIVNTYAYSARTKVHVTGHPFSSEECREQLGEESSQLYFNTTADRIKNIVWSSRWDEEKNPKIFCEVAAQILAKRKDISFSVLTGAKELRSNSAFDYVKMAYRMLEQHPNNFLVCTGLTKAEYYKWLCNSRIQFNAADQDWVAVTLLEATTFGCYPIYPETRSFPETFEGQAKFMYPHKNADAAVRAIEAVIDKDHLWTQDAIDRRRWIYARFNASWYRMLKVMGVDHDKSALYGSERLVDDVPLFGDYGKVRYGLGV